MNFLRKHWYDAGGLFSIAVIVFIFFRGDDLTTYQFIMWLNLVSLFLHQLEEYRIAGTFPGMVNSTLYHSQMPDRYPLNTNTALFINVVVGWASYFLAAILAEKAVWMGIATVLVSVGNIIAHTFLFNIKGKTIYNAGLATCWLFFVPLSVYFFSIIHSNHLATLAEYVTGITIGIVLNVVGILKCIDWLADENTAYVFESRNLLSKDR